MIKPDGKTYVVGKFKPKETLLVMGEKLQSGMYILVVSTEKNTYKLKLSKF